MYFSECKMPLYVQKNTHWKKLIIWSLLLGSLHFLSWCFCLSAVSNQLFTITIETDISLCNFKVMGKFVDKHMCNFVGYKWHNLTPSWSNGASKSAFPIFQVSMTTFSNFNEFWFITSQRAFFLQNLKLLPPTVTPGERLWEFDCI